MELSKEEIQELEEKFAPIRERMALYHLVGKKDRHIIRLFHWLITIDELFEEVRASDMDNEFESQLIEISKRLTHELGERFYMVLMDSDK